MYVQIFSTQTQSNSLLEAKIVDQLLFNVFLHSKIGNATNNFISIGNKVCLKNNSAATDIFPQVVPISQRICFCLPLLLEFPLKEGR